MSALWPILWDYLFIKLTLSTAETLTHKHRVTAGEEVEALN